MKLLPATLALFAVVKAGLRFPCSTLTFQRLDPAGQPGALPSAHLHHIVGGNAFNATMTGDVGDRATCTTCQMAEDFSNYWTAVMYFKDPKNGSYHRVPPVYIGPGQNGAQGGLTGEYHVCWRTGTAVSLLMTSISKFIILNMICPGTTLNSNL